MNVKYTYERALIALGLSSSAVWAKDKAADQDVSNFTGIIALGAALYIVATRFARNNEDRMVIGLWWILHIVFMINKAGGFDPGMIIGPFSIMSLYADRSYGLLMLAFAIFIQLIPMIFSARIGMGYVRSSSTDMGRALAVIATLAMIVFWFYLFFSLYPIIGDYMHDVWYPQVQG
jgi:hypothetical protein